jgi:hypothetical protein
LDLLWGSRRTPSKVLHGLLVDAEVTLGLSQKSIDEIWGKEAALERVETPSRCTKL